MYAGWNKRTVEARLAATRAQADATVDRTGEAERVRALLASMSKDEKTGGKSGKAARLH